MNRDTATPREMLENAYERSVKSENVRDTSLNRKTKSPIKNIIMVAVAAAVITATSVILTEAIDEFNEYNTIQNYCSEQGYYDSIGEYFWREYNDEGNIQHGYNQSGIAEWACSQEEPDIALYCFYNKVDQNKSWNMDEVVKNMAMFSNDGETYDSWNSYLTKKGYVDNEGNPSMEVMEDRILEKINKEKETSKGVR